MTELSGVNWGEYEKPLQPHQMSPKQFAEHPHAVFHSTHLKDPKSREGGHTNIHVGTLAAAMERHGVTGAYAENEPWMTKDATIHVYHVEPTAEEKYYEEDDEEANSYPRWNPKSGENTVHYYKNDVEDVGSTSALVRDPSRLKSQSDFVEDAIRNGKADEVHPITMAMHLTGRLGKWTQNLNDSISKTGKHLVKETQLFESSKDDGRIIAVDVNVQGEVHRNAVPHLGPDAARLGIKMPQDRTGKVHSIYEQARQMRNSYFEKGETPPSIPNNFWPKSIIGYQKPANGTKTAKEAD